MDVQRKYAAFHSLTSEDQLLDLLIIMAKASSEKHVSQLLRFASQVGHLTLSLLGTAFSSMLIRCGKSRVKSPERAVLLFESMQREYLGLRGVITTADTDQARAG